MVGALLTALFFGITPVCAGRAIRLIGPAAANLHRLLVALTVLGAWAFTFGRGFDGPFLWFFAAGAIGFGVGGMAMFQALPRLGAPLSSLLVESLAAVAAATIAWIWLNDALTPREMASCLVVLAGVAVGLLPLIRGGRRQMGTAVGVAFAACAGLGQGISITISRRALLAMVASGSTPHLPTAAFQRLLGGACIALAILAIVRLGMKSAAGATAMCAAATSSEPSQPRPMRSLAGAPWFWVALNALFGPILGVTSLIWALETMQPGMVQTIAATAPLVSVPFARWLEGSRPAPLYYVGCGIALTGLAGIYLA